MKDQDTFKLHAQHTGKITINSAVRIKSKEDLALIYTPGVAQVSSAIKNDPSLAEKYTIAGKTVAVISDGSAVLGLGNIGAKAALPVMEGKCVIFKELGGIDAFPLCLDEQSPKEIISTIKSLAPNFVAINLEDIAAPKCFEIEETLQNELSIPIMHDDQHATAIVTLAALKGALYVTKKKSIVIAIVGVGAAGIATAKLLLDQCKGLNIKEIRLIDSKGLVSTDRTDLNSYKKDLAQKTSQHKTMDLSEALKKIDVFIGVSKGDLLTKEMVLAMNSAPIIFAMANPTPEIMPQDALAAGASIVGTGRSDFPNQINNALVYPGIFKGLIKYRIKKVTTEIKIAAANAIFEYHKKNLSENNILPSILDKKIPEVIASALG